MKLCKDCKHVDIVENGYDSYYLCNSPKRGYTIDEVTGEKAYNFVFCTTQRADPAIISFIYKTCGKSGRFFEPK